MELSVVILNWNSKHYLDACMGSLIRTMPPLTKKEIIIVDNGSKDGSAAYIKKAYPDTILIENNKNMGVGPARNQGLLAAKGKYILILDVDTIVHEGTIGILMQTLQTDKDVGLCGPKLIGPDMQLQYSCREFPTILSKLYRQFPKKWQSYLLKKEELRDWDHNTIRCVGYVIGACHIIRREAFEDIGLFDPRMFYGCEEIDFCLRLWKKGWKVVYNPDGVVTHMEQRCGRKNLLSYLQMQHNKSLMIYTLKHKYILKAPHITSNNHLEFNIAR